MRQRKSFNSKHKCLLMNVTVIGTGFKIIEYALPEIIVKKIPFFFEERDCYVKNNINKHTAMR